MMSVQHSYNNRLHYSRRQIHCVVVLILIISLTYFGKCIIAMESLTKLKSAHGEIKFIYYIDAIHYITKLDIYLDNYIIQKIGI